MPMKMACIPQAEMQANELRKLSPNRLLSGGGHDYGILDLGFQLRE
jgi:hypothetical protein